MSNPKHKQPANPFHPGEILLEEFLEPAGISQAAFSRTIGWTRARLNELIKGSAASRRTLRWTLQRCSTLLRACG